MVFESLVVDLMNKYLSAYIENLDASQLKLGIWGGNAVLTNLHVKGDALKDLDLPVTIVSGFIGKLTLQIPWKNLYKDAVVASLDSLYILAVPNTSMEYDAEKEAEKAEKEKQEQLKEIEEQLAKKLKKSDEKPKQDGFVEKLATQVIKNIQIHVKNIHIRYEDTVTIPNQPFAVGATLSGLDVQTTNENWIPTLLDESVKVIYKMVNLNSLSVYWNYKPKMLFSKASREEQLAEFESTIAREGFSPDQYNYIVKPMTLDTKLRLNPHPENDISKPKILLQILLQELCVNLSRVQFCGIMELVESLDRMTVNAPFRRYRPSVPLKGNSRLYWKYAYNSVLEAGVKRKLRMFSWRHISDHRRKVKEYKAKYKEKLKQKNPSKDLTNALIKMENNLDVFNITLARQSSEMELVKDGVTIKSKKSAHQKEVKESSSWFGGWFGGGKKKEEVAESKENVSEVMDDEQKKLLYEAIGYTEGESPRPIDFPKDYVGTRVNVALNLVSLQLIDDDKLDGVSVLCVSLKEISTAFQMLPTMDGISVETKMHDFQIDGLENDGVCLRMVVADFSGGVRGSDVSLLAVKFEKNPVDETCDQRIQVDARPLKIVYDAATVNHLTTFFKASEDVQLQQIRAVAASKYQDIKEQTATGLKYAIATRKITDIRMKIMSSYVVMPKNGCFADGCEVIVLDLGEINLTSMNEGQTPATKKAFFKDDVTELEEMRRYAYDKFRLEVKNIQLMIAAEGQDWVNGRSLSSSPLHVLEPVSVQLDLQKCMFDNDADLPKLKLDGKLPVLALKISDRKLKNAIALFESIPLPPSDPAPAAPLVKYEAWDLGGTVVQKNDLKTMGNVFQSNVSSTTTSSDEFYSAESDLSDIDEVAAEKVIRKSNKEAVKVTEQLTDVFAKFTVEKISIGIARCTDNADKPLLELEVDNFGASTTVRTWDTSLNAHLGSVKVAYPTIDNEALYLLDTNAQGGEHLLKLKMIIAKPTAPDFASMYENIEKRIDVQFSVFQINANSKAILDIKSFAENLLPPPSASSPTHEGRLSPSGTSRATTLTPTESSIISTLAHSSSSAPGTSGSSDESNDSKKKKRKKKKKKKQKLRKVVSAEVTDMKLTAILQTFSIKLSDDKSDIASIAIKGVEAMVSLSPTATRVEAKLHDLDIRDPTVETFYPNIVCAVGDNVLEAEIVNFNKSTLGDGYKDMNMVDTSVMVRFGTLRAVVVKRFIDSLVTFGENFQDAKQAALEAGAAAQKAASQSVLKLVERNPRIKLDVYLMAPNILIPQSSSSANVVVANLGNVKISNSFRIVGSADSDTPAVCDDMKIEVREMKLSLCQVNSSLDLTSEHQILEPVSINVDLQRNLAMSWFNDIPDISISGAMSDISLKISGSDVKSLLLIVDGNLTESQPDNAQSKSKTKVDKPVEGKKETAVTTPVTLRDTLKLDFKIPKIRLNMYKDKERTSPLAEFKLVNIPLSVRMGSDESLDLVVSLDDVTLDDKRVSHLDGITRHIRRKGGNSIDRVNRVIEASIRINSDGSTDINASIGSLQVILCLEFIMKVTDVFMSGLTDREIKGSKSEVIDDSNGSMTSALSAESLSSDSVIMESKPHESQPKSTKSSRMTVDFELHQPDIILVTDISSSHSQALVLNMKLSANVEVSQDGLEQQLSSSLSGLQLINCPFSEIQNIKSEHKKIIAPCSIEFVGKITPLSQDFSITGTKIQITATPTVINTIAEAVQVLSSQGETAAESNIEGKCIDADIWDTKRVSDVRLWFIENPEDELKAHHATTLLPIQGTAPGKSNMQQIMRFSLPSVQILLESGQGQHTVPLLITETKIRAEIMDWSSGRMEGSFKLAFGVVYFNESLSVWEPLVEPVESDPGDLDSQYELWMLEAVIQQSPEEDSKKRSMSSSSSVSDLPPLMSIGVKSSKLLQTTITNDAIKVLQSLGTAFAEAAMVQKAKKKGKADDVTDGSAKFISAEARIDNMLDTPLNVSLGSSLNIVTRSGPDKNSDGEYTLGYQDYVAVNTAGTKDLNIWDLLANQAKLYEDNSSMIRVSLPGGMNSVEFDVSKTGVSMNTLKLKSGEIPITCVIASEGGVRNVTLRSPVVLKNNASIKLDVIDKDDNEIEVIGQGQTFAVPSKFVSGEKLFVKPHGMDVYKAEVDWSAVRRGDDFHVEKVIDCPSNSGMNHGVSFNVEVVSEHVNSPDNNDTCYEIHVHPVAMFKNYLPYDIEFVLVNSGKDSDPVKLTPGTGDQLLHAAMNKSKIKATLQYAEKTWLGEMTLDRGISELSVWSFKCGDKIMVLGKQITYNEGCMKICLYSPYWMVNNTGLTLEYKAGDDNISQHLADEQEFILFSFTSKSFLSKNKLQVRACNSNFSDSFSIDTVGSGGTITCKSKEMQYMVGTQIHLTSFGLTKIVTFSSYYKIVNNSACDLEVFEAEGGKSSISVQANATCKFWPETALDQLRLQIKGQTEQSANIRYSKLDSGVLIKVGDKPLFVDVSVTESSVTVTVKDYYVGSTAVMVINDTKSFDVEIGQAKSSSSKHVLKSGEIKHLLWTEPSKRREVSWQITNGGKEVAHDVMHEQNQEMKVKIDGENKVLYYAVFVDGLQRVLLFTENKQCAKAVELGIATERANFELDVDLQGFACSLTDTKHRREVMYMAITSSGLVWEEKPKKRWTPLALKYGSKLEETYQGAVSSSGLCQVENYQFDIARMKVLKPHSADLRRSFSSGISLHYTISDHQVMMHAKVNRIQIDNQLPDAVFPVVLHPMPMPKTVAVDSSPKPFVEFSMLQRKSDHLTFPHVKYFQVLIQELSVKVDMGFISALLPVFGADEVKSSPERDLKYFKYDVDYLKKSDDPEETTNESGLTFYDTLHLSPIKVHVSFSMQNSLGGENAGSNVVELPFNALAVVLKSIGVTVSDIDDVVFKLGFFEREYQFFNTAQFTGAITRHYAGQAVKQLYVLVFGLDVIGNPYGLVMGIAEGVTDLFYEPYQGMIQGPGEFAEGLALGAKSLLGHTVGGAAGAVSRVTGALGKGVAALTMDDEYKRKRQMQKNKPTDFKESLARGGKGFVMGFVGGVTGVVTKPMEGAKKEGAAGFFKGVGKGLIGIVARPASGVIDLASNTMEGIQKLADMSEDVKRMRPARWIHEDTGVLQPYKLRKAQGKAILLEVEKGKFAEDARYILHVPVDKNKKSFLLLTDKMILEAHTGEIFGQWNSDWNFSYEEIVEEPHRTGDGIKLVGGKTKKLFGSKTHQRIVTFANPSYVDRALEYMRKIWSDYQHGRKVSSFRESKTHMSHHHHFGFGSHRHKKNKHH